MESVVKKRWCPRGLQRSPLSWAKTGEAQVEFVSLGTQVVARFHVLCF
jgi:hypothetical protein